MIPALITALGAAHDRSRFNSGVPALDRYLREQATQDIRRRVAGCFVALTDEFRIVGYYTLSTASVPLFGLPDAVRRKLPHYAAVPAVLVGRLAVDAEFQGQGTGGVLIYDALRRAARSDIPAAILAVDAKDERAADFYRHHGFDTLAGSPLTLFLRITSSDC